MAGDSMSPGAAAGSGRGHRLGRVMLAGFLAVGVTLAVVAVGPAAAASAPSLSQPPAAVPAAVPAVVPAATGTAIEVHYGQLGGAGGFLGAQTTAETGLADGAYARYRNGVIYYSPATGAWEVHGAVLGTWSSLGAQNSPVGYPVTDERGAPDGVGRYNVFARGSVFWSPGSGAHEVHGGIAAVWSRLGAQAGFLGYPVTNEVGAGDGLGRYSVFQGGSVYYSPATGAYEVHAGIRAKWAALGAETGTLGYPTSNESTARDGVGRYNTFQRGVAYWSPGTGTQEVHGAILGKWASIGAETGTMGYPTSDEYAVPGGRRNNFQNGTITWDAATGATTATPTPTPAPAPSTGSVGERAQFGAFVSGMTGTGSQVSQLETKLGAQLAIASSFRGWGDVFPDAAQKVDAASGHRLLVAWDLGTTTGTRFSTFTSGAHDAYLAQVAAAAKSFGASVYVRPWAEMNGDWQPFQPTADGSRPAGGTPAEFVAAWRYVVTFFRDRGATNVRWVFNPTTDTYAETTPVSSIWPGSPYVDVLGLDGYNWGTGGTFQWKSFSQTYTTQYQRLVALAPTLPVWVCEFASKEPTVNDGAPVDAQHSKATWYRDLLADTTFPNIAALVMFEIRKERDWRIASDPAALAAVSASARAAQQRGFPTG